MLGDGHPLDITHGWKSFLHYAGLTVAVLYTIIQWLRKALQDLALAVKREEGVTNLQCINYSEQSSQYMPFYAEREKEADVYVAQQ